MRLLINEILDEIDKLDVGVNEKILALKGKFKEYPELEKILAINFNHNGQGFVGLPAGAPVEYKPDLHTPIGYSDFILGGIWRKLYIYSDVNLNPARKLQLYLQVLEGLHFLESEILNLAKDGNLWQRYPWIKDHCYDVIFLGKPLIVAEPELVEEPVPDAKNSKRKGKAKVVDMTTVA